MSDNPSSGNPSLLTVRGIGKSFPASVLWEGSTFLGKRAGPFPDRRKRCRKKHLDENSRGVQPPDEGEICSMEKIEIESTRAALDLGISLIHQELNLATNLSVGANVFGQGAFRGG